MEELSFYYQDYLDPKNLIHDKKFQQLIIKLINEPIQQMLVILLIEYLVLFINK